MVGQIVIIGADENSEVNRLIEKGVVQASIVRDAVAMGKAGVALAIGQRIGIRAPERISVGYRSDPRTRRGFMIDFTWLSRPLRARRSRTGSSGIE